MESTKDKAGRLTPEQASSPEIERSSPAFRPNAVAWIPGDCPRLKLR